MDMRSEAELATSISFIDTRPGAMMFEQSLKADHRFVDTFGSFTESMNIILESAKMAGEIDMQFFLSGRFSEHVLEPPVREIESIGSPRSILRRRLSDQIEAFGNRYYQNDDDDESWDSEEEEEDDFWGSSAKKKKKKRDEIGRHPSRRQNVLALELPKIVEDEVKEEEKEDESHPVQRLNKFTAKALNLTDEERKEMISAMREKLEARKDILHGDWDDLDDVSSSDSNWTESDYEDE